MNKMHIIIFLTICKSHFFKDMINSYHASMRRLDPGLYVAYLKMQNSVDSVRVMVNKYMTGSLPCVKIRSVANVSK